MKVKITMLRRNGVRIRERDFGSAVTMIGDLSLSTTQYSSEWIQSLDLQQFGNQNISGQLARLMNPELLNLGPMGMRFRGVESVETTEGRAGVVQEWLVEFK